jgi:hypothetical protein
VRLDLPTLLRLGALSPAPGGGAAPPGVAPVLSGVTLSAALGSVGDTLTATPVYSTAGTAPVVATYQWTRGGVDISGATSSTYTLVGLDEGAAIRCRCSATGPGGSTGPVTSSGLCQVRVYGLGRAALGDDYLTTVATVANAAGGTTVLAWYRCTASGSVRGTICNWGSRHFGAANSGFILRLKPADYALEMVVMGNAGPVEPRRPLPSGSVADGTWRLLWGRIAADGASAVVGVGTLQGTVVTIPGGLSLSDDGYPASLAARGIAGTAQEAAGEGIVAVLGRVVSDGEIAAIAGAGSDAAIRAALLDLLAAESSLRWWPAPIITETDGSSIATAAETEDLGLTYTHALAAGVARLTAEGP